MVSTSLLIGVVAAGSVVVGLTAHRVATWYLSEEEEGGDVEKPMTYGEAMALATKVAPADVSSSGETRRRRKRKQKPELVTLSMLRYGEYSTDDTKLTIQAWRPDSTHRLAGHVVVDIIPKPTQAMAPTSVRRLAVDLETVEAARLVLLEDAEAVVLAVSDYEVKGQGVIFKDLDYAPGVGVDDTTLYVVLVMRHQTPDIDDPASTEHRISEFRRLARGLAAPAPDQQDQPVLPSDPTTLVRLPNTSVADFFNSSFRSLF